MMFKCWCCKDKGYTFYDRHHGRSIGIRRCYFCKAGEGLTREDLIKLRDKYK